MANLKRYSISRLFQIFAIIHGINVFCSVHNSGVGNKIAYHLFRYDAVKDNDTYKDLSLNSRQIKRNYEISSDGNVIDKLIRLANGQNLKMRLFKAEGSIYSGFLIGQENTSSIYGSLINNSFTGKICTQSSECQYIEPIDGFVNSIERQTSTTSSISYTAGDVQQLLLSNNEIKSRRFNVLKNDILHNDTYDIEIRRFPRNRSCCSLYLKTDVFLWNEVFYKEGQQNAKTTELYIINMLHQVVAGANQIYRHVIFKSKSSRHAYRGFQLKIKRIKILQPYDCANFENKSKKYNLLCNTDLDVLSFLNAHSQEDASEYCLSYTFTARDFSNGTLGQAWSGKSEFRNSAGGICNKDYKRQSFNGGIVTILNFRTRVTMRTLELTFAHEVGHNLGAEHDPPTGPCASNFQNGGSFLMHSDAVETGGINNDKFSECSLRDISDTVVAMVNNELIKKPNCLAECNEKYCGNRIIEENEECDCGFEEDCRSLGDTCCYPADADVQHRCKLKANAVCSRSQGSCCTALCTYETKRQLCYKSSGEDCLRDTFCSGISPVCPINDNKNFRDNNIFCQNFTKICQSGKCIGSICELTTMKHQCFLGDSSISRNIFDQSKLCHLGCSSSISNSTCIDTFDIGELINPSTSLPGFLLQKGSACAHGRGYCDMYNLCRPIDNDGPLARLTRLLLNKNNLKDILNMLTTYWWAALLILCSLILIFTYSLEKCGVSSSNLHSRYNRTRLKR